MVEVTDEYGKQMNPNDILYAETDHGEGDVLQ